MADVVCPVRGEEDTLMPDELTLFHRIGCAACPAPLVVIAELPLVSEPVDDECEEEDDDFDVLQDQGDDEDDP